MNKQTILVSVITLLIFSLGYETGIFWDNVLFVSKMGNPLFLNGIFDWLSIPIENDSGHPPFIAALMASSWKVFGKSLATSHLTIYIWCIMATFIISQILHYRKETSSILFHSSRM